METGMKHLHHFLPFVFFIVLIVAIIKAYMGKIANPKKDGLLTVTLILAHTQLLLGLYLLINFISVAGIHMGEAANRFITVEHPITMLIGVILITVGKVKAKKIEDVAIANKTIFSYFIVALVLIALRTPWDKLF
jgi:hypothetical protein